MFWKINKAVIKKSERRTAEPANPGAPVSENLMRLAIATLISELNCGTIITEPGILQGERYSRKNGFAPDETSKHEYKGKTYYHWHKLSDVIIDQTKKLLQENGQKFSDFPKLLEKMRPIFEEVVMESERLAGAETRR